MRIVFYIICSLWVFTSCSDEMDQPNFVDQNPDDVEIRVSNESQFSLDNVTVNTSSNEWNFGFVRKNNKSSYRSFQYAYPFFSLSFQVNGKQFSYHPISYSGYEKIKEGKYDALIYDVDTIGLTFAFRLSEN